MATSVNAAGASSGASTFAADGSTSSQDIEARFLKLLVAQMRNQDPLSPLSNNEMTAQLAQINTVNGIERLNGTMKSFTDSLGATQAAQATALIGHEVLVPGKSLALYNGRATGGVELAGPADRVTVTVLDKSGIPLESMDLGPHGAGNLVFEWDGVTPSGSTAAPGGYTFEVAAQRGGATVAANTLAFGKVSSASIAGGNVTIEVAGLGRTSLQQVRQIQ